MSKRKIDNEVFKTLIENYNIKSTDDIKDTKRSEKVLRAWR